MATIEPTQSERPFQFTLRQLLSLMGVVCVLSAAYFWIGTALVGVVVGLTCLGILAFVVYLAFGRRFLEALVAVVAVMFLIGLLIPTVTTQRGPSRRGTCQNNLRNLILALQMYEATYGCFPPPYIPDADGKPIHSWRVLILPFLERQDLYSQYRFDEPWDGPNNSKLHNARMKLFECPSDEAGRNNTSYVAVVGSETAWRETKRTSMRDMKDGASNTIMLVEVYNSGIHWMEPRDLRFDQLPLSVNPPQGQGISSGHPKVALVVFADGHTTVLSSDTPPKTLRALLTIAGGE